MGTDPRRLDGLRADEKVAALRVERATGATARARDIGTRQGSYDVDLRYPDGRTAALEVTSQAGPARRPPPRMPLAPDPGADRRRWRWVDEVAEHSDVPGLPDAVTALLAVPHVARRVAKVAAATGVDERHLFVGIGDGGLPDSVYQRLTRPLSTLPVRAPDVPDGISHLWLGTAPPGSPLLCWDRAHGWRAHQVGTGRDETR